MKEAFINLQRILRNTDLPSIDSAVAAYETDIEGTANLPSDLSALVEDWHEVGTAGEPAFANSWVNYSGTDATAAFCKDPFGWVHIKGLIKSGTEGLAAFTLPAGCRPAKALQFGTISNSAFGGIQINATGEVIPYGGSNVWHSINCGFRAA